MIGGNVCHVGENFGDEDDFLIVNLEFSNKDMQYLNMGMLLDGVNTMSLQKVQKELLKLDLYNTRGTLKVVGEGESYFLIHESKEEDDDRTAIYTGRGMDGGIAYGNPNVRCPLWLQSCIDKEMVVFT